MRSVRLFVYGSLLRGESNHSQLAGSPRLAEACTALGYSLVDLGEYPGLVTSRSGSVVGELYEVDRTTLKALDAFEGHPVLFVRVAIQLASGERADAYVVAREELARGRAVIAGGDWRRRRRGVAP